ncbi:GNAT family N-acetyltransferase [Plantactinospora siamensis]|uniref:GNAT family N-acetyltransferase n=1 Tax=Plantactinospora siamensis TaxID=555372 RepID=A0ABV6NW20_9ACTN
MTPLRLRSATVADADRVAALHADSWRRHYRGAYADAFLDGDVVADRRAVWSARLAVPAGTATILAERDDRLVGFIHAVLDQDPRWGTLIDNLHVGHGHQRAGVGRRLLARCADAAAAGAAQPGLYLWVLRQNAAALAFYRRCGGVPVETAPVPPPGGHPDRLNGSPERLRMAWPDASRLSDALGAAPS